MKKILKFLLGAIILVVLTAKISGKSYLFKGIWATYLHGEKSATINDKAFFETRDVSVTNSSKKPWLKHSQYNKKGLNSVLTETLEKSSSASFVIIKNDSLIEEHYWNGYTDQSRTNSFSMAKSITTMLVQCAIQDGFIKGWDQKVTDFFPDLTGEFASELEVQHLSAMISGLEWDESYKNPFGVTAQAYYDTEVWDLMKTLPIVDKPGSVFEYQSGSTMLLGMVVVKATGKDLSAYASEKLWKPLGAEESAHWHVDSEEGVELAYCCFNSNAKDFARFGSLLINQGNWNGKQLLDTSFYFKAKQKTLVPHYGNGYWIDNTSSEEIFYQRGFLGQYIIIIPKHDLVIVRLGEHIGENTSSDKHSSLFHSIVEQVLKDFGNSDS